MGKGDKKSRRGKINNGSYGKRRPKKALKAVAASDGKAKK
ncbi:30S ribosomal protein THX [Chryseobacterium gwangjuense]|nr:30S ribosomal protein THX [Chryseobacterium gwangjuense]MCE3077172.1 30S ribosomal protein THX [Chryseobacterium gwangjuense]